MRNVHVSLLRFLWVGTICAEYPKTEKRDEMRIQFAVP